MITPDKDFCAQKIKEITKENIYRATLTKKTKTLDMMDEFWSTKQKYLFLSCQYYTPQYQRITLILMFKPWNISLDYCQPTMTDLKNCIGRSVLSQSCGRLNYLNQVIRETIGNTKYKNGTIIPLRTPCSFGAQDSSNREDYGCEWTGGGDWEEKTLYGEVTDYMVIGVQIYDDSYFTFFE